MRACVRSCVRALFVKSDETYIFCRKSTYLLKGVPGNDIASIVDQIEREFERGR